MTDEMATSEVRTAGTRHYPDLADSYSKAAGKLTNHTDEVLASLHHHHRLHKQLKSMTHDLHKFLDVSSDHLKQCGKTLVDIVTEFEQTDSINAKKIRDSSKGYDD
jgi:TRAP-type mannitol/chloroaromatic compound transport system substrate-binding protein